MRAENLGLLLWGGVGTGKSFLAGCIANALMEQEVPVRMTFSAVQQSIHAIIIFDIFGNTGNGLF